MRGKRPPGRLIVFIQIGNSDDTLTQREWCCFIDEVRALVLHSVIIGEWFSGTDQSWQNACWMYQIAARDRGRDQSELRRLATRYRQDSIAWTEAPETTFLEALPDGAGRES